MVIAIAFSDIQLHDFKQHNRYEGDRLYIGLELLGRVSIEAKKLKVPLLFAGDLFDNPNSLENLTLVETLKAIKSYVENNGVKIYAISGNHDQSKPNSREKQSPNYLQGLDAVFNYFHLLDFKALGYKLGDKHIGVAGIPYVTGNSNYKELVHSAKTQLKGCDFKILLTHRDYYGALEPSGYAINTTDKLSDYKKMFKGIDLVLSGHIHKPQKLFKQGYMLGATHQQRKSDMGCDMGYWIIYDDKPPKFIKLDAPQFSNEDNGFDYYVPINPIKSGTHTDNDEPEFGSTNRKQLAKDYCKLRGVKGLRKTKLIQYLTDAD